MKAQPVRVIQGAYNGRSTKIETGIRKVQKYIAEKAGYFTDQQEYNKWAIDTMRGALEGIAKALSIELREGRVQ